MCDMGLLGERRREANLRLDFIPIFVPSLSDIKRRQKVRESDE